MMEQNYKDGKRWVVLGVLLLSLFIICIDNMVLNLALPSISRDLGSSAGELQWITDAYILIFASLLLTMGAIGDLYGRRRILNVGLIIFGLGSLAAALSNSTEMLITCRAVLGIGGAMIMPSTLSIITDTFRDPRERAKAISLWAAVFALGAGIGPVIGGYLIEYFDWSAVFYINLPIVAVALAGSYIFIRESKREGAPIPDLPGMVLSTGGLFALVYGLIKMGEESWSDSYVIISLIAAAIVLVIFTMWEKRFKAPMLPLGFFKNMSFTGATIAVILTAFSMMGAIFFMSQFLQTVQGYSPVASALRMLPMSAIAFVGAIMSARVAEIVGNKLAVGFGVLIPGSGMLYYSQMVNADSSYTVILIGFLIMGSGVGAVLSVGTEAMQGSLPVSYAGIASAVISNTRQVGGALGIALLGSIMNATYLDKIGNSSFMASLSEEAAEVVRSSVQGAHIIAGELPADISHSVIEGSNEAFTSGMTEAMFVGAIMMGVCALITFILLPKRAQILPEHVESSSMSEQVAL